MRTTFTRTCGPRTSKHHSNKLEISLSNSTMEVLVTSNRTTSRVMKTTSTAAATVGSNNNTVVVAEVEDEAAEEGEVAIGTTAVTTKAIRCHSPGTPSSSTAKEEDLCRSSE